MARIPDRARMGAPNTPTASGRSASYGDLGLSSVGEALARTGRGLQNAADKRAEDAWLETQGTFDQTYLPEAQAYDGKTPGFAQTQMARFDGLTAARAEQLDPDARRSFERQRPKFRASQMEAALRVESQRTAELQKERQQRAWNLEATERVATLRMAYAGRKKTLFDAFDGSQAGLTGDALAAWDEEAAKALEAAPEEVRGILEARLAAARGDEALALQAVEERVVDTHAANTATKAAGALVAAVVSDPGQYAAALKEAEALGAELPAVLQTRMVEDTRRAITVARFDGLLERGEWQAVLTQLDSGEWDDELGAEAKSQVRDAAVRTRAAAGFDPAANQQAIARQALEARIESHYASLQTTGRGAGVTAAQVAAVLGPAAGAAFAQEERNRRLAHTVTAGMAGLPLEEQRARMESLKPKGGEVDFAQRQKAYELALQTFEAARSQQVADPAQAIMANEASAGLWRAFQAEPNGMTALTWATHTLDRQRAIGVPEGLRRVLPVAEARRLVEIIKDARGADTLTAFREVSAYVRQFASHEGQILAELSREGLKAPDAAIIAQAGDNPAILSDYARAVARTAGGGKLGLTPSVVQDTRAEVVQALEPLTASLALMEGGQSGADALTTGVRVIAEGLVADGMRPREAARQASEQFLRNYRFHRDGWRMPMSLAERTAPVREPYRWERSGQQNARSAAQSRGGPQNRTLMNGEDAVALGALRTLTDLVRDGGAGLRASGAETHLTDAQKRLRAADMVAESGRWITTNDDRGLMLVRRDPTNPRGAIPVLDKDGRPITRTWEELLARADQPSEPR